MSAVGRSLNPMVMPKWFNYNKNSIPFTCGGDDTAVVEDCLMRQLIYPYRVALLGTSLKMSIPCTYQKILKGYYCHR